MMIDCKRRSLCGMALAASLALACGTGALAQNKNALEAIQARGKILVATDVNLPPFGYLDSNAEQSGSDVDAAKLLAQDLGVALEIIPVTGQNRVPYLLSGKADIVMSSFSITEERRKVVDYSDPVGVIPLVLSAPAAENVTSFADLAGKTVAATRGTTPDQELTRGVRAANVKVNIVRYEDDAMTNTAITTGQQRFLSSPPTIVAALKKATPDLDLEIKFTIHAYPYAIGLRKNEPELLAWLNGWVKTNIANGKLNDIYQHHHGLPLPEEFRP